MVQEARPEADAHVGTWLKRELDAALLEITSGTDLFEAIYQDDTDEAFIRSEAFPVDAPYVTELEDIFDPGTDSGFEVPYRLRKSTSVPGVRIDVTVELRQAYISEASPGTLIHSEVRKKIPDTFTNFIMVIPDASAVTFEPVSDLYIRFVADEP